MRFLLVAALAVSMLSACNTTPAKKTTTQGKQPVKQSGPIIYRSGDGMPFEYQAAVKKTITSALKDPYSAKLNISGKPRKILCSTELGGATTELFEVWSVFIEVNAKNSYGAYTGNRGYRALFLENQLIESMGPFKHLTSIAEDVDGVGRIKGDHYYCKLTKAETVKIKARAK